MSAPSRLPLEGQQATPTGPRAAGPAAPQTAVGVPEVAARKGVISALPYSHPSPAAGGDPTPDRPGIRIYAPPVYRHHKDGARWSKRTGDTPNAAYACACGQTATATGPRTVAALVAEYDAHKNACTGAPASHLEGRAAA